MLYFRSALTNPSSVSDSSLWKSARDARVSATVSSLNVFPCEAGEVDSFNRKSMAALSSLIFLPLSRFSAKLDLRLRPRNTSTLRIYNPT
jgi:hypothetical protein